MLDREEYNMTFGCDLSEEEFERIMSKRITDEDILNGRVDKLTFCDKQGRKQEFVKVVRGEWIDDNCSVCGQYVYHGDARNFCPRCGADMIGEERK